MKTLQCISLENCICIILITGNENQTVRFEIEVDFKDCIQLSDSVANFIAVNCSKYETRSEADNIYQQSKLSRKTIFATKKNWKYFASNWKYFVK